MFTSLISLSPIFFTSSLLYCQSIWPSFSSSEDFYWILSFPVIPSSTSLLFPHSTLYGKRSDSICDSKSPRVRRKEKEILQWVKGTREREREREGCHSQTTCFPSQDYASFQIHLEFYISSQQHKLCTSFPFGDWVVCLWLMFAFPVLRVSCACGVQTMHDDDSSWEKNPFFVCVSASTDSIKFPATLSLTPNERVRDILPFLFPHKGFKTERKCISCLEVPSVFSLNVTLKPGGELHWSIPSGRRYEHRTRSRRYHNKDNTIDMQKPQEEVVRSVFKLKYTECYLKVPQAFLSSSWS